VTSSQQAKIDWAIQLGARGGALYTDPDFAKQLVALLANESKVPAPAKPAGSSSGGRTKDPYFKHRFDCIFDGSGGPALNDYIRSLLRPGGKVVLYGSTAGLCPDLVLPALFLQNVAVCGTAMGSDREFAELLDFVTRHRITPVVHAPPVAHAHHADTAAVTSGDRVGSSADATSPAAAGALHGYAAAWPFERLNDALALMAQGRQFGKLVINVRPVDPTASDAKAIAAASLPAAGIASSTAPALSKL